MKIIVCEQPDDKYSLGLNKDLSCAMNTLLSRGQSTNYIVLHNMSSTLMIRMAEAARHFPQSVARYNPFSVTALVQTNNDQEFLEEAFQKLMEVIRKDLDNVEMAPPQLIVSHQEI